MELKRYTKDHNLSYSFGAFPTYELIMQKHECVKTIIIHEKLDKSPDIEKILNKARAKNIPILTNGKLIEKLSKKENIYIMGVFGKYLSKLNHNKNQVLNDKVDKLYLKYCLTNFYISGII